MWRQRALVGAAILAVPTALALAALAIDVLQIPGQVEGSDVRFESAPLRQQGLWENIGFLPGGVGRRLLDVEEDLAYRRTIALFVKVGVGKDENLYGPEAENLRGKVQFELTSRSAEDSNAKRRSVLLNLLAAMSLDRSTFDEVERESVLRNAIQTLRTAIEVDPGNDDAKINLELALRDAKATNLPGTDPSSGEAHGSRSGQGSTGEGGY